MREFGDSPCFAFFRIQSAGVLDFENGFLPEVNSVFPPEEVTRLLGIVPFRTHTAGDLRPGGRSRYDFSAWYGCGQAEPEVSRLEQCSRIVRELSPHIPVLMELRKRYNVAFSIQIFPCRENPDCAVIGLGGDIMDFCHHTGTEVVVDMFLYRTNEEPLG